MKILFSSEFFHTLHGGREKSQYTLLRWLARKHELHAIFPAPINSRDVMNGIRLHFRKIRLRQVLREYAPRTLLDLQYIFFNESWRRILEDEIQTIQPKLVMTELGLAPATIEAASEYGIPTIFFIRSYEHFCTTEFIFGFEDCLRECGGRHCWRRNGRLSSNFVGELHRRHRRAIESADLVLANSLYTRKVVKDWCNADAEVIYPFIDLKEYKTEEREPVYITFVGPTQHKGVAIFIKVAELMTQQKFMVCGVGRPETIEGIVAMKNVKYIPWVDDMKKIYSRTKLLLVPSVWPEPFGRVVVEAMVSGIPCIVSQRGGLPEAVGEGGIKIRDIWDVRTWVDCIRKLEDCEYYSTVSERAKLHAKNFDAQNIFQRFSEVVEARLHLSL